MSDLLNTLQDLSSSIRTKHTDGPDTIHVDPHFIEDPAVTPIVEFAIKRRKNLLIVGPTGCGKSSLAINVAARLKESLEIFSCSGETTTDELIAKPWRKSSGETISVYGAGTRAYKDGKGLLLEEIDHANPDILAALHRTMETNQNFIILNVGEKEVIARDPRFFVVATANTIGTGEDTFMYAGTKPLNAAFMNRFNLTIKMSFLKPDQEIQVLCDKTGITGGVATKMTQFAQEARKALSDVTNRIATVVSTRDLLEWADLICGTAIEPVDAAQYSFLNRANESDRDVLQRMLTNHF